MQSQKKSLSIRSYKSRDLLVHVYRAGTGLLHTVLQVFYDAKIRDIITYPSIRLAVLRVFEGLLSDREEWVMTELCEELIKGLSVVLDVSIPLEHRSFCYRRVRALIVKWAVTLLEEPQEP